MSVAMVLSIVGLLLICVLSYAAAFVLANRKEKATGPASSDTTKTSEEKWWARLAKREALVTGLKFALGLLLLMQVLWFIRTIDWSPLAGTPTPLQVAGWAWVSWFALLGLIGSLFSANYFYSSEKERPLRQKFLWGAIIAIFVVLPIAGTTYNYFNPSPLLVSPTCPSFAWQQHHCTLTEVWSHPVHLDDATVKVREGDDVKFCMEKDPNTPKVLSRLVAANTYLFKSEQGAVTVRYGVIDRSRTKKCPD